jgi:hypothetical protein
MRGSISYSLNLDNSEKMIMLLAMSDFKVGGNRIPEIGKFNLRVKYSQLLTFSA